MLEYLLISRLTDARRGYCTSGWTKLHAVGDSLRGVSSHEVSRVGHLEIWDWKLLVGWGLQRSGGLVG
jgi:hypothetical protein